MSQQQLSTLSEDRQFPSLPNEAVSTPLPPSEITMGLLAQANEDVLLSMLDARRLMNGKTMLRPGLEGDDEQGGGGEQRARSGDAAGSKGIPPKGDTGEKGHVGYGWSIGPSERGVPLGLVARLATRDDLDSAISEMEPPLLRPDMPRCHAKDLRVPQTFKEAKESVHSTQFMDATKREIVLFFCTGGERRVGSSIADAFSRGRVTMTLSPRRLSSVSIRHLARVDTAATLLIEPLAC